MKLAIPIIDADQNNQTLSSGLNVNGSICIYNLENHKADFFKTNQLAENIGELLPALESLMISAIITQKVHPMALKILNKKGFKIYKAYGNNLKENIQLYQQNLLENYSHEASMELANICGGECTSCASDICDDDKKHN